MLYNKDPKFTHNCPQCGDALTIYFKYSKLVQCSSCGSSIFLEDDGVRLIGQSAVLSPEPSLIQLHKAFIYKKKSYLPIGKIRYSYGRGFWEEWFLKDEKNKEFWLSIDEGDFVLQEKVKLELPKKSYGEFRLGSKQGKYLVTEKDTGTCVGFEGELPQSIELNEKHKYIHLSLGHGKLVTVEFTKALTETFRGEWIDPLEIEVQYA